MIGNRVCAFALWTAFTIIGSAPPALAAQFDGNWSMVAVTTRGHCGRNPDRPRDKPRPSLFHWWSFRFLPDLVWRPRFRLGQAG